MRIHFALAVMIIGVFLIARAESPPRAEAVGEIISTVAGDGVAGFSGDGGSAANARVSGPASLAIVNVPNKAAEVYFADTGNCRIRRISPEGAITTVAGNGSCAYGGDGGAATSASLNLPSGISVDTAAGTLLIADTHNCRIRRVILATGIISTVAGNGICGYSGDGLLAINAQLNLPMGVTHGGGSTFYVADTGNCRVREVTSSGEIFFNLNGTCSNDISLLGVNLVLSNPVDCRVSSLQAFFPQARTTLAGDGTCAAGPPSSGSPTNISILGPNGSWASGTLLYFAEAGACRIRVLVGSLIDTVAGDGNCGYAGDGGNPLAATLNDPADVAVDQYGYVYIADRGNNRIRRVSTGTDEDNDGWPSTLDNCPAMANTGQANSDSIVEQTPPYAIDDSTMVVSDTLGDVCDTDDDNDGLSDAEELTGAACAGHITDPLVRETDGDLFLDGAECGLGTDPTNAASKPLLSDCGPTGDSDGDKIMDRIEVCKYNSSPNSTDTDGDKATTGAVDGCEVASFNNDRVVNVADMGMLSSAISNSSMRHPNTDVNKDGFWNPADQGIVAGFITPSGQCPG